MLVPVLLSGGVGSRLWPVSRELHPKQLLPLAGEFSMLQDTLRRTQALGAADPIVVCNEAHRFLVAEQMRQIAGQPQALILEPAGRNTAPALALAALQLSQRDPEAVMLVLPADHLVQAPEAFVSAVRQALPLAESGRVMSFGVVPTSAETGYGYIACGEAESEGVFALRRFVEKPDRPPST